MRNVANRNWRKCQSFVTQRRFQLVCASQRWLLLCLTLITREAGFTSFCTLLRHLSSSRDRLHSANEPRVHVRRFTACRSLRSFSPSRSFVALLLRHLSPSDQRGDLTAMVSNSLQSLSSVLRRAKEHSSPCDSSCCALLGEKRRVAKSNECSCLGPLSGIPPDATSPSQAQSSRQPCRLRGGTGRSI